MWAEDLLVVGRAGFHGPPDAGGMVEVGYAVDPDFRRRGNAIAALLDPASTGARGSGGQRRAPASAPGTWPPSGLPLRRYGSSRWGALGRGGRA